MVVYSFLEPGLYGGVEWNFYHWSYGRILGWADGEWEDFDPVYIEIFLRSVRLAATNVLITLLICYPAALWVSSLPARVRTFVVFMNDPAPGLGGTEAEVIRADMVFFETPSGGAVFSTGSIAWAGSLSHASYDNDVARITTNVLRRFLEETPFQTSD